MPIPQKQIEGASDARLSLANAIPLWQLDIAELAGHNIEARGREEVNRLLQEGWLLLHIYTLKYEEDGVWRERPMAILGRPKSLKQARQRERPTRGREKDEGRLTKTSRGFVGTSELRRPGLRTDPEAPVGGPKRMDHSRELIIGVKSPA